MDTDKTTQTPEETACEPLLAGQLARNAITTIEEVHHAFLKSIQVELTELLQENVTTAFQGTKQTPVSTPLRGTKSGDRAIQLSLAPLSVSAYLVFPPALLFRILDILLATPASATPDDDDENQRMVTGIELFILREFFEVFAKALREAWAPVYPAAFTQMPASFEEEGPAVPDDTELALVLRSGIAVPGLEADFVLVLPTFLARMAHLKAVEASTREGDGEPFGESILRSLGAASVNLEAVLQGPSIRIRDLLAMAPGQILTVANSEDSAFDCLVNGKQQFTGSLVSSGERCGFRVEVLVNQTESQLTNEFSADR